MSLQDPFSSVMIFPNTTTPQPQPQPSPQPQPQSQPQTQFQTQFQTPPGDPFSNVMIFPQPQQPQEQSWGNWLGSMALRTGPTVLGSLFGGIPGGVGGAAVGNLLGQGFETYTGVRNDFNPWEFGVDTALGAIPPIARAPGIGATADDWLKFAKRAPISGAVEGAAINTLGTIPQHIAQTGLWELPSAAEFGANAVGGTLFGAGFGFAGTVAGNRNAAALTKAMEPPPPPAATPAAPVGANIPPPSVGAGGPPTITRPEIPDLVRTRGLLLSQLEELRSNGFVSIKGLRDAEDFPVMAHESVADVYADGGKIADDDPGYLSTDDPTAVNQQPPSVEDLMNQLAASLENRQTPPTTPAPLAAPSAISEGYQAFVPGQDVTFPTRLVNRDATIINNMREQGYSLVENTPDGRSIFRPTSKPPDIEGIESRIPPDEPPFGQGDRGPTEGEQTGAVIPFGKQVPDKPAVTAGEADVQNANTRSELELLARFWTFNIERSRNSNNIEGANHSVAMMQLIRNKLAQLEVAETPVSRLDQPSIQDNIDEILSLLPGPGSVMPHGSSTRLFNLEGALADRLIRERDSARLRANLDELNAVLARPDLTPGQREHLEYQKAMAEENISILSQLDPRMVQRIEKVGSQEWDFTKPNPDRPPVDEGNVASLELRRRAILDRIANAQEGDEPIDLTPPKPPEGIESRIPPDDEGGTGNFDPEAVYNDLSRKLGREPTDIEMIEGMQRQAIESGPSDIESRQLEIEQRYQSTGRAIDKYRLPDGSIVAVDATATKGIQTTDFQMKDGSMVKMEYVGPMGPRDTIDRVTGRVIEDAFDRPVPGSRAANEEPPTWSKAELEAAGGKWDVFDPRDGITIRTFNTELGAKLFIQGHPNLDYAPRGAGHIKPRTSPDSDSPRSVRDPGMDDLTDELHESLEAGGLNRPDSIRLIAETMARIEAAPDAAIARYNMDTLGTMADNVTDPTQKMVYDSLYDAARKKLSRLTNEGAESTIPPKEFAERTRQLRDNISLIQKGREKLANIWNAMKRFVGMDDGFARESVIYDSGTRLTPEEMKVFENSPVIKQFQGLIDRAVKAIADASGNTALVDSLVRTGVILDPKIFGLWQPHPAMNTQSAVLINIFEHIIRSTDPRVAARNIMGTLYHEIAHSNALSKKFTKITLKEYGLKADTRVTQFIVDSIQELKDSGVVDAKHDITWIGRKAELFDKMGEELDAKLRDEFDGIIRSRDNSGEIQKILSIYSQSRRRPSTTPDYRSREGIESRTRGRSAGNTSRNTGTDGEGASDAKGNWVKKKGVAGLLQRGPNNEPSFKDEALGLATALTTTGDFSGAMRQGLPAIFTKEWWKAIPVMFKAAWSEKNFQDMDALLRSKDIFQQRIDTSTAKVMKSWADDVKFKLIELGEILTNREEAFASNWVETGGMFGKNNFAQKTYKATVGRFARASNRGYAAFLNHLRTNTVERLANNARDMSISAGETGYARPGFIKQKFTKTEADELNPFYNLEAGKAIVDFVNTATGRGPLRTHLIPAEGGELNLEKSAERLRDLLFSPRLLFARIRMLNPNTYIMAPPAMRKQYMKAALSTASAWFTIAQLGKMAGAEVSDDPDSADFGKIRIGDTRLDPGGGFQQFIVAAHRFYSGGYTSSSTGEWHPFGAGFQATTQRESGERFLANKLNPVSKFAWDLLSASQYQPFHVYDRTAQMFVPLVIQDVIELANEDPDLLPLIAPIAFGMGTQTYGKGESISKFIAPEDDWLVSGGGFGDLPGGIANQVSRLWD